MENHYLSTQHKQSIQQKLMNLQSSLTIESDFKWDDVGDIDGDLIHFVSVGYGSETDDPEIKYKFSCHAELNVKTSIVESVYILDCKTGNMIADL